MADPHATLRSASIARLGTASAENLWQWLRSQYLSNQVFEDVGDLLHKTDAAWLELTPERIKTLCHCPWIVRANQA